MGCFEKNTVKCHKTDLTWYRKLRLWPLSMLSTIGNKNAIWKVLLLSRDMTVNISTTLPKAEITQETCFKIFSHTFWLNSHVIRWTSQNTSHPDHVCDNHLIASHM